MPNPSSKAVYVPSAKRRQLKESSRFHGAFTGGFSAGYFNTVGSKEGWTPSNDTQRQQQIQDFMDDEDHQDFGGPNQLRSEYSRSDDREDKRAAAKRPDSSNNNNNRSGGGATAGPSFDRLFQVKFQQGIGMRLMRQMGWRQETSSAIITEDRDDFPLQQQHQRQQQLKQSDTAPSLSNKRIRKLKLQQSRMRKMPPPKFDQAGLGFQALENAPEFQKHREYRKKLAQQRTRGQANVYRTATIADGRSAATHGGILNADDMDMDMNNDDDHLAAYDTMEDFVGTRTVGGFALRDDADDAYDEDGGYHDRRSPWARSSTKPQKRDISKDMYNTEIYEHVSSDDENDVMAQQKSKHIKGTNQQSSSSLTASSSSKKNNAKLENNPFGGLLSAWAGIESTDAIAAAATSNTNSSSNRNGTSSQKPKNRYGVLDGFRLAGVVDMAKVRYPGPDVPRDWNLHPHRFAQSEHPHVFQDMGHAVKLTREERQRDIAYQEALDSAAAHVHSSRRMKIADARERKRNINHQQQEDKSKPMAGKHFSELVASMKTRFRSGAKEEAPKASSQVGLHFPEYNTETTDADANVGTDPSQVGPADIDIQRTTESFQPSSLVCKRFHIPTTNRSQQGTANDPDLRSKEEKFFQQHVLDKIQNKQATQQRKTKKTTPAKRQTKTVQAKPSQPRARPSMTVLKSIFQSGSDDENGDDNDDDDGEEDENNGDVPQSKAEPRAELKATRAISNTLAQTKDDDDAPTTKRSKSHSKKHKRKRGRKDGTDDDAKRRKKEKRKRHRKDDSDSDGSSSDDDDTKNKNRKRHHKADSDRDEKKEKRRHKTKRSKEKRKKKSRSSKKRKTSDDSSESS